MYIRPTIYMDKLICWEQGGAIDKERGFAVIYCNENGDPIYPAFCQQIALEMGPHACFIREINQSIIEIIVEKLNNKTVNIEITKFAGSDIDKLLWSIYSKNIKIYNKNKVSKKELNKIIPESFLIYINALVAACEKANCLNCKEPYYISHMEVE